MRSLNEVRIKKSRKMEVSQCFGSSTKDTKEAHQHKIRENKAMSRSFRALCHGANDATFAERERKEEKKGDGYR